MLLLFLLPCLFKFSTPAIFKMFSVCILCRMLRFEVQPLFCHCFICCCCVLDILFFRRCVAFLMVSVWRDSQNDNFVFNSSIRAHHQYPTYLNANGYPTIEAKKQPMLLMNGIVSCVHLTWRKYFMEKIESITKSNYWWESLLQNQIKSKQTKTSLNRHHQLKRYHRHTHIYE